MRIALAIMLLLAVTTFTYSFVGESKVWACFSEVRAGLAGLLHSTGTAYPDRYSDFSDTAILRLRSQWRVVRWLSAATSLAAFTGLLLASRGRKHDPVA